MADHKGHPLPRSDEARHGEIPEGAERDKGRGDDPAAVNQPAGAAVTPEGEPYRVAVAERSRIPHGSAPSGEQSDLGNRRDPGSGDDLERDQAEHQDRGQSIAAGEASRG